MSFTKPLIEDLKKKGLHPKITGRYKEIKKSFTGVPTNSVRAGIESVSVSVSQKSVAGGYTQYLTYEINRYHEVIVSYSGDEIATEAITKYLNELGYKKIRFIKEPVD